MTQRSRGWCFTTFFEGDAKPVIQVIQHGIKMPEVGVIGEETCPKTGRKHLQGYVYLSNARTFNSMKDTLPAGSHIEKAVGNVAENYRYCTKEGEYVYWGSRDEIDVNGTKPGKRSDIDNVRNLVKSGADMEQICDEVTSYQALRFAENVRYHYQKHRTEAPTVYWLWGLSGVGKTRWVHENFESVYIKDGTQWWNGYDFETCICIDDFDGHWPFRDLLRLLDRYKYQGQIKGGYTKINSPFIVITCEFPPEHFWQCNELSQVSRRLHEVRQLTLTQGSGVILTPTPPKDKEDMFEGA